MKKEDFLKAISGEDEAVILRLFDRLVLSEKTGKTVYSKEFYTPGVWSKVEDLGNALAVKVSSEGIFEEAERRMLAFYTDGDVSMPITAICITNKSKFHTLQHKDYLGAMMSLGIKREKIGDLVVDNSKGYCAVCEDIATYLISNLTAIGHCPCEVSMVTDYDKLPSYSFEEKIVLTTSMRADCVVSSVTGLSRSRSVDILKAGKVLINYNEIREKDFEVTIPSTLTIRGYGKFKVSDVVGNSGSGRLKILLKKFV
ncbi:RNA-binding protein [Clostridium thermarum]|uniref:YlmH family RNA-binding protein n=1 Tax=Clostridium thermarum TaxID=1716543 RepID=UPI0013D53D9D|nr:YlmH/Sll1252 family protein [Clostridium thermarum]